MKNLRILTLDDERQITEKVHRFLTGKQFDSYVANTPGEALDIIDKKGIDLFICDIMLPDMNGIDVLKKVRETHPEIEVIMMSGYGDMDTVIQAVRMGAVDFIRKPFSLVEIELAIERTRKYLLIQNQLEASEDRYSLISRQLENSIERDFIGISPDIQQVLEVAMIAAKDKDVNVLITGENGTGKEIVARIIHFASERKQKSFYPVNSAAIPESLLESEFFGHSKGSFTDATENKKGCFELATGGTLFLDEISEMSVALQAKLLRAIEEKKIRPLGGNKEITVDVRIISATNRNLKELVEEKKFRPDLFHRINTLVIPIPPLRERPQDVEPLVNHFVASFARQKNLPIPAIDPWVIGSLKQYAFPGNVRELRNMVERAMILAKDNTLTLHDFPLGNGKQSVNDAEVTNLNVEDHEKQLIRMALEKTGYNQEKASQLLGISRFALLRKLKKFRIKIERSLDGQ